MKPITELTIGHVGKTIRVTDGGLDVTGTLGHLEAGFATETIFADLRRMRLKTTHNFDITLLVSGIMIGLTLNARWEPA